MEANKLRAPTIPSGWWLRWVPDPICPTSSPLTLWASSRSDWSSYQIDRHACRKLLSPWLVEDRIRPQGDIAGTFGWWSTPNCLARCCWIDVFIWDPSSGFVWSRWCFLSVHIIIIIMTVIIVCQQRLIKLCSLSCCLVLMVNFHASRNGRKSSWWACYKLISTCNQRLHTGAKKGKS